LQKKKTVRSIKGGWKGQVRNGEREKRARMERNRAWPGEKGGEKNQAGEEQRPKTFKSGRKSRPGRKSARSRYREGAAPKLGERGMKDPESNSVPRGWERILKASPRKR